MKNQKITEIDFLRTIAFLAVVMQHILGSYLRRANTTPTDNIIIGISFGLVKFAVPLFVFISGVVLFYNYYHNLKYFNFLKKRIIELIIPYVLWSFFYTLWESKSYNIFKVSWVIPFIKSLILGSSRYHLWYVVMIFQAILILPILFVIMKCLQKKIYSTKGSLFAFTLFSLVYIGFITYYYDLFCHFPSEWLNTMMERTFPLNFLSYIFYFILGSICGLYYDRWKKFVTKYFIVTLSISSLLYFYIEFVAFSRNYSNGAVNLNSFGTLNLRFFLFSTFSILMLYAVALFISNRNIKADKVFAFVGKYSYDAYLAHAFVLSTRSLSLMQHTNITNLLLFYILLFIVTSVMSVVIGYMFRKSYDYVVHFFHNCQLKLLQVIHNK